MSDSTTETPTAVEIQEVITELEKYRERLINDRMEAGKKAKLMKSAVMQHLEPELQEIDARLDAAREMLAELG